MNRTFSRSLLLFPTERNMNLKGHGAVVWLVRARGVMEKKEVRKKREQKVSRQL